MVFTKVPDAGLLREGLRSLSFSLKNGFGIVIFSTAALLHDATSIL